MSVSVAKFGESRWSTFAYVESRCVDFGGKVDKNHMRTDRNRHPALVGGLRANLYGPNEVKYPTILKGGEKLEDHDDWDCIEDLIAIGLVSEPPDRGTGLNPVYELTDMGWTVVSELKQHKSRGGTFAEFVTSHRDVLHLVRKQSDGR